MQTQPDFMSFRSYDRLLSRQSYRQRAGVASEFVNVLSKRLGLQRCTHRTNVASRMISEVGKRNERLHSFINGGNWKG